MKRVVSVSLGSPAGDFAREVVLDGQTVHIAREGTNGDFDLALSRIAELDGTVDAIGLGGIDVYLYVGGEQFVIGDGLRLAQAAKQTPVVDGSGLKNTLERRVVETLASEGHVTPSSRVLMVSALDRFGMAEAFVEMGCPCVFGDLIFNIGLDYGLTRLDDVKELAEKYRKRLLTVPFHQLYPTGSSQNAQAANPTYAKHYEAADIIAGDAHLILRHLPPSLSSSPNEVGEGGQGGEGHGKGVITNTTRPQSMARLRDAGAAWVATTTPDIDGVSGGTNVMEAALVALMEKRPEAITAADYNTWITRLGWRGSFHSLAGR